MTHKKNRQVLEDMQEGYYEIDLEGTFTFANKIVSKIAGLPVDEIIGLNFVDYTSKSTAKRVFKVFSNVYQTGIPQRIEYEIILRDNTRVTIENSVILLHDDSGRPIGFCGLVQDITRRKRLEKDLKESRGRFKALFENANELIITTDAYGYIKRLNKKVLSVSGYSSKYLLGKSILLIAHPDDRERYIYFWKDILKGEMPSFEVRAMSKDKRIIYLLASGSVVKKGSRIVEVQYNAQEISDLKHAQQTIEDLKNQLASIFESSPNMIICLDSYGSIQMANPITERIFHRPLSSVIGKKLSSLSEQMINFDRIIQDVQEYRTPQFFHEQYISNNAKQVFDVSIYPLMNPSHGGVVFTAVDISEKKHMEIQLIHAQKMETIGELAGGVAHDFNNILTGISGNLAMLKRTQDRVTQVQYIETLEKILERAKNLIQQMLVFTKRQEGRQENISVSQVIREVLDMSSKSIPKNIRVEFAGAEKDCCVFMDYTQLTQVMLNLIVNAKDAIGDNQDGMILIDINTISVSHDDKKQYLLETAGRFVKIDVADNGGGMDNDILPKIFDPFFTTKEKGPEKGIGLGLSITYNIIKNAGGSVQVISEVDKGSKFSMFIPLSISDTFATNDICPKAIKGSVSSKARILFVDDEEMLRDIGSEMIEFLGHEVETAADGYACLDKLENDSKGFDLIILDMIMPGLDGYHTIEELIKRDIRAKVIISTGFSFEHEKFTLINNSLIVSRLNKPFNLDELSKILDETLS